MNRITVLLGILMSSALSLVFVDHVSAQLTGTYYGDDNGVYYVQRQGDQVSWLAESVDKGMTPYQVWHRGIDWTSVLIGTVQGTTMSGQWADVSRGVSTGSGTITIDSSIPVILKVTGGNYASNNRPLTTLLLVPPIDDTLFQPQDGSGPPKPFNFYDRYSSVVKGGGDPLGELDNPHELRPFRDQTVFYGELTTRNSADDEDAHVNFPVFDRTADYRNFLVASNNDHDGDLDFRMHMDLSRLPKDFFVTVPNSNFNGTGSRYFGIGWDNQNLKHQGGEFDDCRTAGCNDSLDFLVKLVNFAPDNISVFTGGDGSTDSSAEAAATSAEKIPPGSKWSYLGIEGVMYGADGLSLVKCFFGDCSMPNRPFPGWADLAGNSILVNGRPINGGILCANSDPTTGHTVNTPCNIQTDLSGLKIGRNSVHVSALNGNSLTAGGSTEIRVTGGLILDCGHHQYADDEEYYLPDLLTFHTCEQREGWEGGEEQNQEIHPFYSLDIIEPPLEHRSTDIARPNISGAWGSNDGGTYYIRQIGNTIWWAGLTRNRAPIMPIASNSIDPYVQQIPDPAIVFKGTLTPLSDGTGMVTGQALTVPKGLNAGGASTSATFVVGANHKSLDLLNESDSSFPFPTHFDKLWEAKEDVTPPVSTLSIGTPQYTSPAAVLYVTRATPFNLSARDDEDFGSGVQNFWYRFYPTGITPPFFTPVDGTSASFDVIGADGLKTVDTFATDNAGNDEGYDPTSHSEKPNSITVYLDDTPPTITIIQPAATQYPHSATLTLNYTVTDGAGSGVKSFTPQLDGNTTLNGHGLVSGQGISLLTELSLGSHTFSVNTVDNVGNADASSVVFTIIVTPDSVKNDVKQFLSIGAIKNEGLANSLSEKLDAAGKAFAGGDCATAGNIYQAFINEVNAQNGEGVAASAAAIMIGDAQYLIAHCP